MTQPYPSPSRISRPIRRLVGCAALLLVPVLIAACSKGAGESSPAAAAPAPIAVRTVQVTPQSVPIVFEAVGQTEGAKEVEVRARTVAATAERGIARTLRG